VAELAHWLLSKGQIAESAAAANSGFQYSTGQGVESAALAINNF